MPNWEVVMPNLEVVMFHLEVVMPNLEVAMFHLGELLLGAALKSLSIQQPLISTEALHLQSNYHLHPYPYPTEAQELQSLLSHLILTFTFNHHSRVLDFIDILPSVAMPLLWLC